MNIDTNLLELMEQLDYQLETDSIIDKLKETLSFNEYNELLNELRSTVIEQYNSIKQLENFSTKLR